MHSSKSDCCCISIQYVQYVLYCTVHMKRSKSYRDGLPESVRWDAQLSGSKL